MSDLLSVQSHSQWNCWLWHQTQLWEAARSPRQTDVEGFTFSFWNAGWLFRGCFFFFFQTPICKPSLDRCNAQIPQLWSVFSPACSKFSMQCLGAFCWTHWKVGLRLTTHMNCPYGAQKCLTQMQSHPCFLTVSTPFQETPVPMHSQASEAPYNRHSWLLSALSMPKKIQPIAGAKTLLGQTRLSITFIASLL